MLAYKPFLHSGVPLQSRYSAGLADNTFLICKIRNMEQCAEHTAMERISQNVFRVFNQAQKVRRTDIAESDVPELFVVRFNILCIRARNCDDGAAVFSRKLFSVLSDFFPFSQEIAEDVIVFYEPSRDDFIPFFSV